MSSVLTVRLCVCLCRCVSGRVTCWCVKATVMELFTRSALACQRLPRGNSSVANATRVGNTRVWQRTETCVLKTRQKCCFSFLCCFQVYTRALCARRPAVGWSAASYRCVGSSTTTTVYWRTPPHSRTTKAPAALCMCVCPATSPTLSTSVALKVRL